MALAPTTQKVVLHWGEMGSRWGVSRSVAQIHALLYLSDRPLPADEIADELGIARSNVSVSLKELQGASEERIADVARSASPPSAKTLSVHVVEVAGQDAIVRARSVTPPNEAWGLGGGIVSTASPAAAAVRRAPRSGRARM